MLDRFVRHAAPLRALAVVLLLAVVILTAATRGLATGLLVLAACALVLVIGLVWASVQSLTGQSALTLDDALSLAAPRVEEEQKRAVLRALKDLEYERSVGKITEEDYAELSARYRRQAKELLRSLDESLAPSRERVAALVEKRVAGTDTTSAKPKKRKKKSAGASEPSTADALAAEVSGLAVHDERKHAADDSQGESAPQRPAPTRRCLECNVRNELDARFCKSCGESMAAEGEHACTACPARYPDDRDACPDCGVERSDA